MDDDPSLQFSRKGCATGQAVLALRAEIEGQRGGKPPAPDKYIELGYYDRALKNIERT